MRSKLKSPKIRCYKAPPAPKPVGLLTPEDGRAVLALMAPDGRTTLDAVRQALPAYPDLETSLRFSGFLVNDGIVS